MNTTSPDAADPGGTPSSPGRSLLRGLLAGAGFWIVLSAVLITAAWLLRTLFETLALLD